jgi:hypothetical protein
MKRILSLLGLSLFFLQASAQDAAIKNIQGAATTTQKIDTSYKPNKNGWIRGAALNMTLNQIGNSNWIAAGSERFSLSVAGTLNAFANRKWGRKYWDNMLDINYGIMNTTSLGLRKINDRVEMYSKYGYRPKNWNKVSVSFFGQLRTQLTSGYEYDYMGTTDKRRNSGFFAPAYLILAPGVDWRPNDWFSLFGSPLATRMTIVSNGPYSYAGQGGIFNGKVETPLATLYGVDPAKGIRGEFGAFVTATAKRNIFKDVAYYGKLDLYSNYLKNPTNVDVFMTNQFKFKIGKYFNVSYNLDMLYDDDVRNPERPTSALGLQVLSTFGLGFGYRW